MNLGVSVAVFWAAVLVTAVAGGWAAVRGEWRFTAVAVVAVILALIIQFL